MSRLASLRRSLRQTLPWTGIAGAVVAMVLLSEAILAGLSLSGILSADVIALIGNPFTAIVCLFAAGLYGFARVCYFLPLFRVGYREWLKGTPWQWPQALPDGPVLLRVQDLLIVGLLTLGVMRSPSIEWYAALAAFLIGYHAAAVIALALTGETAIAYALVMLPGVCLRWQDHPWVVGLCVALIVGLGQWGLVRSLRQFADWDLTLWKRWGWDALLGGRRDGFVEAAKNRKFGWPFDRLGPQRFEFPVTVLFSLKVAVLCAWWSYLLMWLSLHDIPMLQSSAWKLSLVLLQPALMLAGLRLVTYHWGYLPPLGLLGRLRTGRLLIPRYDIIFLGPLLILLINFGVPFVADWAGLTMISTMPLVVGLMVFAALATPPSLDAWRLTGSHRIIAAMQWQSSEFQQGA